MGSVAYPRGQVAAQFDRTLTFDASGQDTRFRLTHLPKASAHVFRNGLRATPVREAPATVDEYLIDGYDIVFGAAPRAGDVIVVDIQT